MCVYACVCAHARVPSIQASVCSLSAIKKKVDADWETFSGENKEGESERDGWREGGNVVVEGASELTLRMASLR